jgi:hypothetical protein
VDDDNPGPGFAVFRWTGSQDAAPQEIQVFGDLNQDVPHFHPEAIIPLKERTVAGLEFSKQVLLISDDGTKPMPQGGVCKDVENGKSFRGMVKTIP